MEEENTQCSRKLNGGGLLHRQSLPDDLIIEILLRLPCVCKSWKTLISDLQFAKQHLQSLTMDPSIANRRFFFGRGDGKIVSVPVKPLLENPSEPIEAVEFSMEHSLRVLGSCNGLVKNLKMEEENTQCSRKLNGGGLLHRQSLPDDLIIEILLRLPVRSLLLLKCVCKSWKTLISDLQFAKQHLQSLTMDPSIANRRFFFGRGDGKIVSVPVKPLLENPSEPIEAVEFSMEHSLRVLGSCNGLVCLLEIYEGNVYVDSFCIGSGIEA
ncbi:hypothetical protein RYX36_005097 [Vicia faba]